MTREIVKRIPNGLEFVSCEIIDPPGKPFNPDGFIEIALANLLNDIKAGKFDHLQPEANR